MPAFMERPLKADAPVETDTTVSTATWWKVTVKAMFDYANTHFEPTYVYYVPDTLYQGTLPGGATFASMCASAQSGSSY